MKVLDALQAINEKYDADISFRSSCRAGQCGSCGILFKGNGALACQKEIKDGAIIEPLRFPVIKDLIVDKSSIEAKVKDLELSLQCDHKCDHQDPQDLYICRGCNEDTGTEICIQSYLWIWKKKYQKVLVEIYYIRNICLIFRQMY